MYKFNFLFRSGGAWERGYDFPSEMVLERGLVTLANFLVYAESVMQQLHALHDHVVASYC